MIRIRAREIFALLSIVFLLAALSAQAAEPQQPSKQETSEEELVKQTQNPIANLISLPLQNNWYFESGKKSSTVYVGNIQPVIPITLNKDWNLITRTIMPIINQPSLFSGTNGATGLGDINPQFYFSTTSGELIWGIGPTFTLPTATDRQLGAGKFSMGPAAVALTMQGHWVFGVVGNNQWSVAGWGSGHVNQMLIQPFVNYNLPDHWYLVSAPIMTANWAAAKGGDVWTVPLGGGVGKLFRLGNLVTSLKDEPIGKLPINTQLQVFGNVARPEFGEKWQLRFQIQLLFPK